MRSAADVVPVKIGRSHNSARKDRGRVLSRPTHGRSFLDLAPIAAAAPAPEEQLQVYGENIVFFCDFVVYFL